MAVSAMLGIEGKMTLTHKSEDAYGIRPGATGCHGRCRHGVPLQQSYQLQ